MALRDEVQERYPALVPLLSQPEIGGLLTRAVKESWSPGKFQSAFIASRWFRSQSESQRRWWITAATDPGEAKKQRNLMEQQIGLLAQRLGIKPTRAELQSIRENALRLGVGADDFWVRNQLVGLTAKGGRTTGTGAWLTTATQVRNLARGEYFWPIPDKETKVWTQRIVSGAQTIEDYQAALQQAAMRRHPHMAQQLAAGQTVAQIIEPYRSLVADEWGMTPDQIDVRNDPTWRQLLGIRDPKSGKTRLPTETEAIRLARSRTGWFSQTSKGRQADAQMTTALLNIFGKRAG